MCNSRVENPVIDKELLGGRWELVGVFQDAVQITDTIGSGKLLSSKNDHVQMTHTLSTDSGLYTYTYIDDNLVNSKVSLPLVLDIEISQDYATSKQYFLIGSQMTKEQEFVIVPDTFQIKYDHGAFLHYSWADVEIKQIDAESLALIMFGKDYHYKKLGNGL